MIAVLVFLFGINSFQLDLNSPKAWDDLARPWMTRAEAALYSSLSAEDRARFRGFFTARRLDRTQEWPAAGLYLPCFFAPSRFGDVRDQLHFVLGDPLGTETMPENPALPRLWRFRDYTFAFHFKAGERVQLAESSLADLDRLLEGLVKHPELRYDFRVQTFGRRRLPDDIEWLPTRVHQAWLTPDPGGATLRVALSVTEEFKDRVRRDKAAPLQHMELLVFLKHNQSEKREQIEDRHICHASIKGDVLNSDYLIFETHLPEGFFAAELVVYSGFLNFGLRAETTLASLPLSLPRIGDPLVSQDWMPAGITVPDEPLVLAGDTFYRPALNVNPKLPARVLVASAYSDTNLWLQQEGVLPRPLKKLSHSGNWFVFELPPQTGACRLIAQGGESAGPQWAMSSWGPAFGVSDTQPLEFKQANATDYLNLETLNVNRVGEPVWLFVNGRAVLASTNGEFPWPPLDWGQNAPVRFEYARGDAWRFSEFSIRRNQVFQEIRVKPKYIVAGTRHADGRVKAVPFELRLEGALIPDLKATPLTELPKLWGFVVNDPLLRSQAWPSIKQAFLAWLKDHTHARDLIYIVHISHRPELVLPPTRHKVMVQAFLDSLTPKAKVENFFTVQYLIHGLTHLEQHETMPHQVVLLTNQLTGELEQLENLLPTLRQTGLQIYNLEFPFELTPESEQRFQETKADPLLVSKVAQDERERINMVTRDNIQQQAPAPATYGFRFGGKNRQKLEDQEEQRAAAFRDAFNIQLGNMTAGIGHQSGFGETMPSLYGFLDQLTIWQETLYHIQVPVPYIDERMISLKAKEPGYSVGWTLVEWRP